MQENIYCPFCGSVMSAGNRIYRNLVYMVDDDGKCFDVKCAVCCDKCNYAALYVRSYDKDGLHRVAFDELKDND